MIVGNGEIIKFWFDFWISDKFLFKFFFRLFLIFIDRLKILCEMGFWDGMGWKWCFRWRRKFFIWEENLLTEFFFCLEEVLIDFRVLDKFGWSLNFNGMFLAKLFCFKLVFFY